MAAIQKQTLAKMAMLHAVFVEFGPMCVSDAANVADLHKGSRQDWVNRLVSLGCAYEVPRTSPICTKKNARYYGATEVPFPSEDLIETRKQASGGPGFEFSRRMVKAEQLGLRRDDMLTAFYGAPKA